MTTDNLTTDTRPAFPPPDGRKGSHGGSTNKSSIIRQRLQAGEQLNGMEVASELNASTGLLAVIVKDMQKKGTILHRAVVNGRWVWGIPEVMPSHSQPGKRTNSSTNSSTNNASSRKRRPSTEIRERLLAGETLSPEDVVTQYKVPLHTLRHVAAYLRQNGADIERTSLNGKSLYRVVSNAHPVPVAQKAPAKTEVVVKGLSPSSLPAIDTMLMVQMLGRGPDGTLRIWLRDPVSDRAWGMIVEEELR